MLITRPFTRVPVYRQPIRAVSNNCINFVLLTIFHMALFYMKMVKMNVQEEFKKVILLDTTIMGLYWMELYLTPGKIIGIGSTVIIV